MQKFTQKYTIVQFFDDIDEGHEYSSDSWPLHSTIVDTFAIDWSVDEMASRLKDTLKNHATADSVAEDDRFFGDQGQVQVVLLNRSDSLLLLVLLICSRTKIHTSGKCLEPLRSAASL